VLVANLAEFADYQVSQEPCPTLTALLFTESAQAPRVENPFAGYESLDDECDGAGGAEVTQNITAGFAE